MIRGAGSSGVAALGFCPYETSSGSGRLVRLAKSMALRSPPVRQPRDRLKAGDLQGLPTP